MRNMCSGVIPFLTRLHHCVLCFLMKQGVAIMSPIATVESVSILLYITIEIGHELIVLLLCCTVK